MREQSYTSTQYLITFTGEDVLDALRTKYPHIPMGAKIGDIPNAKPGSDWLKVRWHISQVDLPTKQGEIELPTPIAKQRRGRRPKREDWKYSCTLVAWTKQMYLYKPSAHHKENEIAARVRMVDGQFKWFVTEYNGTTGTTRVLAEGQRATKQAYTAKGAATKSGMRIVEKMGG